MKEWNVIDVQEYWPSPNTPCWAIRMTDGNLHRIHLFPKMTLAARSIEYEIPERETDVLLDIVLHEGFVPDIYLPEMVAGQDPAVPAGIVVPSPMNIHQVSIGDEVGATCHTADTLGDGRAAHLLRVEEAKNGVGNVACANVNLFNPIHRHREPAEFSAYVEQEFRNTRDSLRGVIEKHRRMKAKEGQEVGAGRQQLSRDS